MRGRVGDVGGVGGGTGGTEVDHPDLESLAVVELDGHAVGFVVQSVHGVDVCSRASLPVQVRAVRQAGDLNALVEVL